MVGLLFARDFERGQTERAVPRLIHSLLPCRHTVFWTWFKVLLSSEMAENPGLLDSVLRVCM